jgi:hypothetical protein
MKRNFIFILFCLTAPLFSDDFSINSLIDYNLIKDSNINAVIYYYPLYILRRNNLTIDALHKIYHERIEINNIDAKNFILGIKDIVLQEKKYQGGEGDIRCCVDFFIGNDLFFYYAINADKFYMFINGLRLKNNNIFYDFINNYISLN